MTANSSKRLDLGFNPVPKPTHKEARGRAERAEFPAPVRKKIVAFFRGKCAECGRSGEAIHHIKFRSQGGRGVFTNGLLLCTECHVGLHKDNDKQVKWQFWAEKHYGPNYFKDEDDLRGEKSFAHPSTRRKNKKGPKKKQPKKKWPNRFRDPKQKARNLKCQ